MQITVRICHRLQKLTDGAKEVIASGKTIGEVLEDIKARYPRVGSQLYDNMGKLYGFVHILLNGEDMRFFQAESTPLQEGDTLSIVFTCFG